MQSTRRSFGLDKFEDMMQELAPANVSGIGQARDEAANKMAVLFTCTRGWQAARTKIQGGWYKSRAPGNVSKNPEFRRVWGHSDLPQA